jgi:hypothetical protein
MNQRIALYNIGCEPSPSIPAETLLQDGMEAFLLFFAVSKEVSASGYLDDLGVAVLECVGCAATKFGYPNDEGLPEHPLYSLGLADAPSSVLEVVGSTWAKEVDDQLRESCIRIRGNVGAQGGGCLRHFVVCLKERTFECLAQELVVNRFTLGFPEAFAYVQSRFSER